MLGLALNGNDAIKVPSVADWYHHRGSWTFSVDQSDIAEEAIEIKDEYSQDLDLFYSVD